MPELSLCRKNFFKARAMLVGERLDLRAWGSVNNLATSPLTVEVKDGGVAVLFRYGVVVFFDVAPLEELGFLEKLGSYLSSPYESRELEELEVTINPEVRDAVKPGGVNLEACTLERLQLVADILSKSVLLARYEARVSGDFDRVEPLAMELERKGRIPGQQRALLKNIGAMLLIEQRMVGRAEISEKPEILWEHPGLEALFVKLQDEFEIRERHQALERKLNLVAHTAQSLLELLASRHALRVEWYIVILIVFEILLSVYQMFFRR